MSKWNPTQIGDDYKRRDKSGRTEKEHHLAAADGHDAQARRAEKRGDHAAAQRHQDDAEDERRQSRRYFPI